MDLPEVVLGVDEGGGSGVMVRDWVLFCGWVQPDVPETAQVWVGWDNEQLRGSLDER